MKRLLLITGGIMVLALLVVGLLSLSLDPKPKVKALDGRYSPAAISTDTVKLVKGFTVLFSNESMEGIGRGTGVLLSSTTVLTCAHVIPDDKSMKDMWIYPYPGAQVVRGRVKFMNKPKDLALIELTTPVTGLTPAVLAEDVKIGEPMVSVGNIKGSMIWFVSYGIISGEHGRWVLSDATIRGGNSGGPWVNVKGEVIAITDVGWNDNDGCSTGISGGVPVNDLRKFLAHSKLKKPDLIYEATGE